MNPQDQKRDDTPTSFKNPLKNDFIITYRNEDNVEIPYVIPSKKISTYPAYLANYFKKHLIDEVVNTRGIGYLTQEIREEIEKELEV